MIRVWVARDATELDPPRAARDAASQALALSLAREAGMRTGLREDDEAGQIEAFFTGEYGAALQLLSDLGNSNLEVHLLEVTTEEEHEALRGFAGRLRGGLLGGGLSEYGRECPVELVEGFGGFR